MNCAHFNWNFDNDWCNSCYKTAEQLAGQTVLKAEVLPGIVALSNDAFKLWSRQHGVRWTQG